MENAVKAKSYAFAIRVIKLYKFLVKEKTSTLSPNKF